MTKVSLSLILMVHNEEETIAPEIATYYREVIEKFKNAEFFIAEDGSTDNTRDILKKLQKKYKLKLLTSSKKRGYAASLRLALQKAKGDVIFYADAGNKHNPKDFWKLYKQIQNFDLVSGYKAKRHDPWYRIVLARGLNTVVSLYFGLQVKDVDSGFKLMTHKTKQKILKENWLLKNNISFEIMLRAYAQGAKIKEVPIIHKARKFGVSRGLPPKKILSVVLNLLTQFPALKKIVNQLRKETQDEVMLQNYTQMFPEGNYRVVWEGKISAVYKLPKYLKIIKELLGNKKQSVLEIGAGDGEIASYLLSDKTIPITSYTATEYAVGGVQQAKKVLAKFKKSKVLQMDATDLNAKNKSFDTVFAIDVMHHVSNPQKMGKEMIRVAKSKVFLIESNALSLARQAAQLQTRYIEMGEKSYFPWQYQSFLSSTRVKTITMKPFLFMVPRIPEIFIPLNIFLSELLEKIPFLKWQCTGVIITVTLKK